MMKIDVSKACRSASTGRTDRWLHAAAMLCKVLVPVVRPGIVAALIFCFLVSWNEFLFAMILTSTPKAQTIPVVIAGFLNQAQFYEYGPLFAASVLVHPAAGGGCFLLPTLPRAGRISGAVKG